MCGIFGYVGDRGDAAQVVLEGLKKLEYRGYDSWGVAVPAGGRAVVDRRVGKIGVAEVALPDARAGLGHTRWATHGGVAAGNAHPHLDCGARLAVVHNGIVANDAELRRSLVLAGHRVDSQTDTELIAHLVEDALETALAGAEPDADALLVATISAFRLLRGLNAVAVLDARTGAVAACKSGSPLVIGHADGGRFLASDASALLEHTRRVTFMSDGQAVLLSRDRARLYDVESGREVPPVVTEIEWRAESADRGTYPDFMTKEIHEQPAMLARLAASLDGAHVLARRIAASDDLFVAGCGSAWHAALFAQYAFARAGRRATACVASEFAHALPLVRRGALFLALSQSGETIDVLDAARVARGRGAQIAAMSNVEGSSLWRLADLALPLGAGPERCVMATKSLTAKLAAVLLVARALEGRAAAGVREIELAAEEVARLLEGPARAGVAAIAEAVQAREHLFVLGRGQSYPIALEAALKIKEGSYVHAEGFAAGELKHGVIALVEPGTPCVVLVPNDDTRADVLAAAAQVKARGATVIGLSPESHEVSITTSPWPTSATRPRSPSRSSPSSWATTSPACAGTTRTCPGTWRRA